MLRLPTHANHSPGRNSDGGGAGRYRIEDDSSGPDDCTRTDFSSGQDDRANPYMCKRMHDHASAQKDPRRKMHMVANFAVMLDNGGCVHNAIFSNLRTRIDHDSRHDDGPVIEPGRL